MARPFRLAAVADLHCRGDQRGKFREMVKAVNGEAEGVVLCGDLTDRGLPEEASTLAEALTLLRVPCAAVLGNHDFEANQQRQIVQVLREAKVAVLDGEYVIFDCRLGVAGVKGFGCGFDKGTLQAFGEPAVKAFVQEAVGEALKLESALGRDRHAAPGGDHALRPGGGHLRGRASGIRPFLGTSRLAMPVDAFGAQAVFHGHAHHGTLEGRTPAGVPVYNVAMPVLRRVFNRRFRVLDILPPGAPDEAEDAETSYAGGPH